jgi:transcriptional regulator NrdR family protein
MKCRCGHLTKIIEKRNSGDRLVRRRHECIKCKKRFTTYERVSLLRKYATNSVDMPVHTEKT